MDKLADQQIQAQKSGNHSLFLLYLLLLVETSQIDHLDL
jgi:hypothetical protein